MQDPTQLQDPLQMQDPALQGSMNARRGQRGGGRSTTGTANPTGVYGTGNAYGNGGAYGASGANGTGGANGAGVGLGSIYATMPAFEGELPADVADAVLAGLNDEYHAMAVYNAVLAQFGNTAPFNAIVRAEANHAASLESAAAYYGIDISGIVPQAEALNISSVAEACEVAANAEIANFELYDSWLDTVSDYPDLVQIFTNLRDASEFNHLPAFQACAG
jgi:hypothetical protein